MRLTFAKSTLVHPLQQRLLYTQIRTRPRNRTKKRVLTPKPSAQTVKVRGLCVPLDQIPVVSEIPIFFRNWHVSK